ncbi:hypothetical protein [Halomonas getboli]|uniref:hypothetical protein n=1 Tax=Halomonas getboli TaxID=2935862 RepID=UPI00200011E6|nr:hypothetical protein [Halomonas getboli]MCK2183047.1 hypothetical protein [Halomonas getboli]
MNTTLSTVRIPENLALFRKHNPKDHLGPEDLAHLDTKTIFYDIFINHSGKQLIAIGPPALNLYNYIHTTEVLIDGKRTAFSFRDLPEYKLSILTAKIESNKDIRLDIIFKDFKNTFTIEHNKTKSGKKILAAISKNNEPEWVATWAEFHRHNYNLDDVIVYDNGSENIEDLRHALDGKAHIIDWHFPYGPPGKRFNKFAQPGALNHCLKKFCHQGMLFNLDIDELLIAENTTLEKEAQRNGTVYIDSHNVPKTQNLTPPYTHYDFTLCHPERRKKARKFVCMEKSVDVISQHNTWKHSRLPLSKKLHRTKPEKLESDHAYFLHFLAITTNWQPSLGKLDIVEKSTLKNDSSHIERKP